LESVRLIGEEVKKKIKQSLQCAEGETESMPRALQPLLVEKVTGQLQKLRHQGYVVSKSQS
jgi:hypothetical protein